MIRRTTLTKTVAGLAVAGTLTAALTGCGSDHRTTPATRGAVLSTTATAAPGAPGTPASDSTPASPTGLALRVVLPTPADLAAGITVSDVYDSGSSFTARADLSAPALPTADCTAAPAIDAEVLTGDYRAAYASEDLANTGTSLQLVVAATNPGDAARQLAEVRDFAERCASFAAPDSSGASVGGSVALDSFAGIGDEVIRIRVSAAGPNTAK